jgi:hypothetical protein
VFLNASASDRISDSCDDCVNYLNEKANWGLRKSKLILLAENTKMKKQTGV